MNRFKTLMLREWMQHQRAWLILLVLPLLLFIGGGLFGQTHVNFGDAEAEGVTGALAVAGGVIGGLCALTLALAWGASLLQSPGLARRDTQDRSIEFWLSLPVGHAQSIGAMLLMHLLVLPWAALGIGIVGGIVISMPLVAKVFGIGAWFALPWGTMLVAIAALALRVAIGIFLASLWLSPLILGTMAASAWLKRWGVPAVVAVIGIGGLVLSRVYDNRIVWDVMNTLGREAWKALLVADRSAAAAQLTIRHPDQIEGVLQALPAWSLGDLGHAMTNLASPAFFGALACAAVAFALLVLRRRRGA